MFLTGLFYLACSATFLIQPRTTYLGLAKSVVDWTVLSHLSINSNATDQWDGGNCLIEIPSSEFTPVWVKLTNIKEKRRLSFHCNLVFNVKRKKKTLSITLYSRSDCLYLKHYIWEYFPFFHCFIYEMTILWLSSPRITIQFCFRNRWPLFH